MLHAQTDIGYHKPHEDSLFPQSIDIKVYKMQLDRDVLKGRGEGDVKQDPSTKVRISQPNLEKGAREGKGSGDACRLGSSILRGRNGRSISRVGGTFRREPAGSIIPREMTR
jgi:hypothetical protein